ncbi:hypothetical protein [Pseudodesulfovibrio tunisiensis]|uniref:hypothetical protein n=1 Tax=Pseudodesulfovibrio tunisiensis TaxID=463192 RepID=UPI001FB1BA40|nr:hypothetical protein [Pseudodesulfovibrio tunisiensis]
MLIYFPSMHPGTLTNRIVSGSLFFDPGLTADRNEACFRPEGLPLDPAAAQSLVRDCVAFGEQFKDPAEMAYFGVQTSEEFYAKDRASAIQQELLNRISGNAGEKAEHEARARAQFVLVLAWSFEERMLELQGIEQGVKRSWGKFFDETLGMDEEDRREEKVLNVEQALSHTGGVTDGLRVDLPWQRMIEALAVLLPEDSVLVCTDEAVASQWRDMDIEFVPAAGDDLPEGAQTARVPAWRLAGRRSAPKSMPHVLRDMTVVLV